MRTVKCAFVFWSSLPAGIDEGDPFETDAASSGRPLDPLSAMLGFRVPWIPSFTQVNMAVMAVYDGKTGPQITPVFSDNVNGYVVSAEQLTREQAQRAMAVSLTRYRGQPFDFLPDASHDMTGERERPKLR